jgi:hypothetical protein
MEANMQKQQLMLLEKFGWFGIIILTLMGIGGASGHILDTAISAGDIPMVRDVNIILFGQDFFQHWLNFREYSFVRLAHMVPGLLFMILLPLQFVKSIRLKHPKVHKTIGYTGLILSIILIPSGLTFAFVYPYVGFKEQVPTVFYACLYITCVYMGVRCILKRDIVSHREWMIRVYAMGSGIYAIRIWYTLFMHLSNQPSSEFFASAFWIGIAFNLVIAETWINLTRPKQENSALQHTFGRKEMNFTDSERNLITKNTA